MPSTGGKQLKPGLLVGLVEVVAETRGANCSVNRGLTQYSQTLYSDCMRIRNVLHKGLRRFIEDDDKSGIQAAVAEKLRRMISFLQDMEKETELKAVPSWKAHQLTGDRKGTWSLFVTKNWRLTFRIDKTEIEIIDLDYEDYH
jgi:proteic killer suppression protein